MHDVILEGTLDEFTLDEVFEVVGLTRQLVDVELVARDRTPGGRVRIRSGMVLDAERPPDVEGAEAFTAIYHRPGTAFTVRRVQAEVRGIQPLGTLSDLVRRAREGRGAAQRTVVMEGGFDAFTFEEVMQVCSLSRQFLEVRLYNGAAAVGRALVKAGRVVRAEAGGCPALRPSRPCTAARPRGSRSSAPPSPSAGPWARSPISCSRPDRAPRPVPGW